MAEPELDPTAALVRRYDPLLFRTALFVPEPGRGRLMTLYAFDVELSRALSRTGEPMISRMRLQWWRDVLEGAAAGTPERQHEVAGPLHALVANGRLPRPALDGLIEAREVEIEGVADRAAFDRWAALRFGGLTRLAAACLSGEAENANAAAAAAGQAIGIAFALRHAAAMAAEGRPALLPGLEGESAAALARGQADGETDAAASALAGEGLAALALSRRLRPQVPRPARVAFLPLAEAEPVLRNAARPGADLRRLRSPNAARVAAGMLWRAVSGRW